MDGIGVGRIDADVGSEAAADGFGADFDEHAWGELFLNGELGGLGEVNGASGVL
ncbi:MAG: hypothetical protein RLZZ399_835 [Verrucomicrobiota bacterium]